MKANEEEEEGQARQERWQRWQRRAAVVEADEELCPPSVIWQDVEECGGWSGGATKRSCWRCNTGGDSTNGQDAGRSPWLEWQQGVLLEMAAEGAAAAPGVAGGAS